jgi:glucose-1-phosphate thymidylyltransferase
LEEQELFVGDVIQSAFENDIQVDSVVFKNGDYLDIGTPEDIVKAVHLKSEYRRISDDHC